MIPTAHDPDALRFGIHAGQQQAGFPEYLALWKLAEEVGLDWASVFDHFLPIESDPTGSCFEGLTLLSAMAAHTERLRCGVIVLGVTYRHPAVLANMAATIDHVSGGRLELGLGAAWYRQEHDQYGIEFPRLGERLDRLDEACHVLRGLWTETEASYAGRHYRLEAARCEPKPLQQRLPLWIGGSGEKRTLRIVAEHADGWNTFQGPLDEYRHKTEVLARHCADVGRDPGEIRRQLVVRAILRDTEAEAQEELRARAAALGVEPAVFGAGMVVGTAEQCAEILAPYRDLGARDFLVLARPPADPATLTLLAQGVAPALRAGT